MKQIGIYGAGGFGREVAWLLSTLQPGGVEIVGYIDDDPKIGSVYHGRPVFSFDEFARSHSKAAVSIAIGKPATREKVAARCIAADLHFATVIHGSVEMSDSVKIGTGSIICSGSILTVDIEIGEQVHINLDCTVGHDARLGDFTTLAPGVHVSGNVHIGRGVYIGTGANIINGTFDDPLVIGDGTVIGAGACVTKSLESRSLYAGVPAQLKKRY